MGNCVPTRSKQEPGNTEKSKKAPQPRILIVQNDVLCPPASAIESFVANNITYQVVYAFHKNALKDLHPEMYEAILVLGGRASVYDYEKPEKLWLKNEINFIKSALEENVPILGICLGCQILAHCLGGEVKPGGNGVEIDFDPWIIHEEKNVEDTDPFVYAIKKMNLDPYIVLFHGDTFSLPETYTIPNTNQILDIKTLAKSTRKGYRTLFKAGKHHYGFQGHPELNYDLVNIWCHAWDRSFLDKSTTEHLTNVVAYAKKYEKQMESATKELFDIWIDVAIMHNHEPILDEKLSSCDVKSIPIVFKQAFDNYLEKFTIVNYESEVEEEEKEEAEDNDEIKRQESLNLFQFTSMNTQNVNKGLKECANVLSPKLLKKCHDYPTPQSKLPVVNDEK